MMEALSPEILDMVQEESIQAHLKHATSSLFDPLMSTERKLAALVEEVGEVGRALTYDGNEGIEHLIHELIQVANVALSWADCLSDNMEEDA